VSINGSPGAARISPQGRNPLELLAEQESERLLRGFLSAALFEAGLYCRADDRGDPVVQLAPPLISGPDEFDEIYEILHRVLSEASRLL
jgi:adenosylmethionine-8-amino-7-oxononanoate aminotransferase